MRARADVLLRGEGGVHTVTCPPQITLNDQAPLPESGQLVPVHFSVSTIELCRAAALRLPVHSL